MRILGFVGFFALSTLAAFDGRSHEANNADLPARPKAFSFDVTQARTDGTRLMVRDSQGHHWPLTMDLSLQRTAQRMLANVRPEAAAFVAIEVKTGKVRVLTEFPVASSPADSILLGRQFPAASVFKIVTTAALVEQAHVGSQRSVCIDGGMHRIEPKHLLPPRSGVVQCKPFFEALGYSRNAAFAQLATQYLKTGRSRKLR